MPWETVTPERQVAPTITLEKAGIGLSSEFIRNERLEEYSYIEVRVDRALRRIGFIFREIPTPQTLRPYQRKSGAKRLKISSFLSDDRYSWIREAIFNPDGTLRPLGERRFVVEVDETVPDATSGVRYYISIGYRFSTTRDFAVQGDYPRLAGVYRLYKDGEIVRIGESDNLERRLKDHYRDYGDRIDAYDFVEIDDLAARKAEERRLLIEFEETYGRLPKYNPIKQ